MLSTEALAEIIGLTLGQQCKDFLGAGGAIGADARAVASQARVTEVIVEGDTATVKIEPTIDDKDTFPVVRLNGVWVIGNLDNTSP